MKIEVPSSWEAITLRKYQAMNALFKESKQRGEGLEGADKQLHDFNTECALISLLTDTDMDAVLAINRSAHNSIMNALAFLQDPIIGNVRTKMRVNGQRYYFEKDASKINGGQWISLMHFLQDENKIDENLHNLIACFASRYKWLRPKYNGKIHEDVAKDMLDLPITFVKPLTDFFLSSYLKYAMRIVRFSEIAARGLKRKAERMLARSKASTDGSTP
jgi:hypothetical protein